MKIKSTLTAATLALLLAGPAFADDDGHRGGRDRDRGQRHSFQRDDDRRHDGRDDDRRRHNDDWRRDDDRRHDGRDSDRRRHDDEWRHDGRHNDRFRRHVPPSRYRADFGYRSAYELAWSDWARYGRHDRRWHRSPPTRYRFDFGYRSGYESGWRDASRYYGSGYRPRYWSRDPYGSWYFGFHITS